MTTLSPMQPQAVRLTQYSHGGGCACKIPPGSWRSWSPAFAGGAPVTDGAELIVGLEHGDDAAVARPDGDRAVIVTTDFFTPVVDDAYDWGRIAQPTRCPTCTPWAVLPLSR